MFSSVLEYITLEANNLIFAASTLLSLVAIVYMLIMILNPFRLNFSMIDQTLSNISPAPAVLGNFQYIANL